MLPVKLSTARTIVLGPFVDSTDGVTPKTALTIAQADIRLSVNGGAFAQTHNATGGTHMENGHYSIPLDTTDTGTVGILRVAVYKSGALPCWLDCAVMSTNAFDSFISDSGVGMLANTQSWKGNTVNTAATAGVPDVNVKNMNNVAATSITTINANQGTTQPINFTGTAGSALAKSDMVDVAGAAVSTSTAQLGVNVVNFGGSAGTFTSGKPTVQDVAGNVTGNVGGNVTGSVGSLTTTAVDNILDRSAGIETSLTPRQGLRLMVAALAGKLSGAATTTVTIRDTTDSKNRLVATVDSAGNRSAITTDLT